MTLTIRPTYTSSVRVTKKSEHIRVSFQKHDKVAERVPSQTSIAIKSGTVVENMSP